MSTQREKTGGGLTKVVLVVAVLVALMFGATKIPGIIGDKVGDLLSALNPFQTETTDITGPSVLKSLTELSEFTAASAYYETVVDIKDDTNNLPDFISGERVIYVGKGRVQATVNFSELDERRIDVSDDGTSVSVTLPAPEVGEPQLDVESSYVADLSGGLIDGFRGSDIERRAQLVAIAQMTTAATGEANLVDLAENSTTTMLNGLFGSLGYTDIMVDFEG